MNCHSLMSGQRHGMSANKNEDKDDEEIWIIDHQFLFRIIGIVIV